MPRTYEQLIEAGWGGLEARSYVRGAESTAQSIASAPLPAARPEPGQLPAFTAALAPRVFARGDRGTWARTTIAGMLKAVVSPDEPDEPAREMAAARAFADDWEYRYGRRPSMAEARLATGRRSDGVILSGTAAEIGRAFATAGLPFATQTEIRPLPGPGDVISQPVRQ